jgi:hypothetical protein
MKKLEILELLAAHQEILENPHEKVAPLHLEDLETFLSDNDGTPDPRLDIFSEFLRQEYNRLDLDKALESAGFVPRRCRECGEGEITPLAKSGRVALKHLNSYHSVVVEIPPADFEIPTCDHCGAEWLDHATREALAAMLETIK